MANLTYDEIRNAVRERRFPTSSPVDTWIDAAYEDIWNLANWTFRYVSREQFYVTDTGLVGGTPSRTPKMPTAFAAPTSLYDDAGDALLELTQAELEGEYATSDGAGRPEAFCVVNRQVILGPAPDSAYAFEFSYRRRTATRTAGGAVQPGGFQAGTDLPFWDEHHFVIVQRAKIIGLRDRSDPTAVDLEGDLGAMLENMREDYVLETSGRQLPAWR